MENLKVKKVTCGLMQELNEMGLIKATQKEVSAKLLEIGMDESCLQELCTKIFDEDFSDQEWKDFDLSQLIEGWNRFLRQYTGNTES